MAIHIAATMPSAAGKIELTVDIPAEDHGALEAVFSQLKIWAAKAHDTQSNNTAMKVPITVATPAAPAQTPIDVASTLDHDFTPYHDRTSDYDRTPDYSKHFESPTISAVAAAFAETSVNDDIGPGHEFVDKIPYGRTVHVAGPTLKRFPDERSSWANEEPILHRNGKSNKWQSGPSRRQKRSTPPSCDFDPWA